MGNDDGRINMRQSPLEHSEKKMEREKKEQKQEDGSRRWKNERRRK